MSATSRQPSDEMESKLETRNSKLRREGVSNFRLRVSNFGFRISSLVWFAGLIAVLMPCGVAYAQGCALCARSASALKATAQAALRSGILVLLIPPALIFIGIFVLAFRSRERFSGENSEDIGPGAEFSEWLAREEVEDSGRVVGKGSALSRGPEGLPYATPVDRASLHKNQGG